MPSLQHDVLHDIFHLPWLVYAVFALVIVLNIVVPVGRRRRRAG